MTTQRELVMDVLLRDGRIEAYDAVYHLTDRDGKPRRITRLAAVIWHLRHVDGWDIETKAVDGKLAVYTLRSRERRPVEPANPVSPQRSEPKPVIFECATCKQPAMTPPEPLLDPRYAWASCLTCKRRRIFVRRES